MSPTKKRMLSGLAAAVLVVFAFITLGGTIHAEEQPNTVETYGVPAPLIISPTDPDIEYQENMNAVPSAGRQNPGEPGRMSIQSLAYDRAVHGSDVILPEDSVLLIDLSYWQNPDRIDYDAISEQVGGVILRIGYTGDLEGSNLYADTRFMRHYQEFKSRGVPVGGYWYACADTVEEGIAEAEYVQRVVAGLEFDLPIFWDTEDNNHQAKVSPAQLTDTALAFLTSMTNAGYETGVYASSWWLNNRLNMSRLNSYHVWVADWSGRAVPGYGSYLVWQFTSRGSLDGYDGHLDFNYLKKQAITRPVTLDANGGSFGSGETAVAEYGLLNQSFSPATLPVRDGHLFAGWYKDAAGTEKWEPTRDKMSLGLTLYAQWEPVYSGIFHLRSAENDMVMGIADNSSANAAPIMQTPLNGGAGQQWQLDHIGEGYYKITSLLNPRHSFSASGNGITEGSGLVQWLYDGRFSQQWKIITDNSGSISLISRLAEANGLDYRVRAGAAYHPGEQLTQSTYDGSLNQQWHLEEVRSFTVSFDTDGGSTITDVSAEWGSVLTEPSVPSKEGMVFGGWYQDPDAITPWNFAADTVTGNLRLYAKWEPIYSGVFYLQAANGQVLEVADNSRVNGTSITPADPQGRSSQLWQVEHTGEGYYKITSLLNPRHSFAASGNGITEGSRLVQWLYDGRLSQQWRINTHPDGSISLISRLAESNGLDYRLQTGGAANRGNGTVVQGIYQGEPHQHWSLEELKTFTVNYDTQGGGSIPGTQAEWGSTLAEPPAPAKDGMIFGGWYKDAEGTIPWNFAADKVTGNVTLYARWTPVYNGIYQLRSAHNNLAMGIADLSRTNGTSILQQTRNHGAAQQWHIEHIADGYYKITSVFNPQHSFAASGNGITEGARLVQWAYDGRLSQQWRIVTQRDGTVSLISRLAEANGLDYRLQVSGTAGGQITQLAYTGAATQQWHLQEVKEIDYSGTYYLRSQSSSQVMDIENSARTNGASILQQSRRNSTNQQWRLEHIADGYYKITSVLNPRYTVAISGNGITEGSRLVQWLYDGRLSQQWKVIGNSDGSISLISRLAEANGLDYRLQIEGDSRNSGTRVVQGTYRGTGHQKWMLDPIR